MRPWKLASETATLDNLSGGRVILAVGLGAVAPAATGSGERADDEMPRRIRALVQEFASDASEHTRFLNVLINSTPLGTKEP